MYTNSLFAMQIPTDYFVKNGSFSSLRESGVISDAMVNNIVTYGQGENIMHWISVHPTFLYEGLWNLALLIFLLIYRKHKKFDGEMGLLYLWGYGLGRVWIEGLRTDSLMVFAIRLTRASGTNSCISSSTRSVPKPCIFILPPQ